MKWIELGWVDWTAFVLRDRIEPMSDIRGCWNCCDFCCDENLHNPAMKIEGVRVPTAISFYSSVQSLLESIIAIGMLINENYRTISIPTSQKWYFLK